MSQASISHAPHRSLRAASLLLSASLLASSIVACGNSGRDDRAAGSGPLPIGAVIALTGNASVIGQDQRLGLELARDHFQGNVQGKGPALQGKGPALELTIEDGGSDEATATNAFRSLIGANMVALIGPSLSQQAFAVDPIADRAGIPVVGPSNTASGIPQIGPFVSRVSAPVAQVAPLSIAAALRLNPKIRSAAVFYAQDDAYSTSESQIFQQALIARNLKPVAVIRTSVSDTDFQSQFTETLSTPQLSPPPCATLAPPPCAELRRRLNTALP